MTSQLPSTPILTDAEVASRLFLLAELQAAFEDLRIRCVLAKNHKLVLRYADGPLPPSGLTDPELYVFHTASPLHVTTDAVSYRLGCDKFPVQDPAAAAAAICALQQVPS